MADEEERASVSQLFETARATISDARRIVTWCAVALAIVWFSGLEGTMRNVSKQERAFRAINSIRQEAERKIATPYSEFVFEQSEVDRLSKLEEPSIKKKIDETNEELKKSKEQWGDLSEYVHSQNPDEAKIAREQVGYEDKLRSLKRDLQSLPSLSERRTHLDALKKELEKLQQDPLKDYEKAKADFLAKEREVDFELLGVKLKIPLLATPSLWSAVLLALVAYLMLVRRRVIALIRRGLEQLSRLRALPSENVLAIVGKLPAWSARDALRAVRDFDESARLEVCKENWLEQIFGSPQMRRVSELLSSLIPFAALLLQLRVAWIGIEFTRRLGSDRTRAIVCVMLLMSVATACWLTCGWFLPDRHARNSRATGLENRLLTLRWLIVAVVIVGLGITVWSHPPLMIKVGFLSQKVLWILWVPLLLGLIASGDLQGFAKRARGVAGTRRLISRRNVIVTLSGLVILTIFGLCLRHNRNRSPRFRQRRRKPLPRPSPSLWTGAPAFYVKIQKHYGELQNKSFDELELEDEQDNDNANHSKSYETLNTSFERQPSCVLHYVDERGSVWRGGRLPKGRVERIDILSLQPPASHTIQSMSASGDNEAKEERERREESLPLVSFSVLDSGRFLTRMVGARVHLASSSWAFEEAATTLLRKTPISRKRREEVCKLLLFAVNHDVVFKAKNSRAPSYRLYDLLAGICVRFKQDTYFKELLRVIEVSGQQGLFETRIEKWEDLRGSWSKRWRDRKRPLKWASTSGSVVF